MDKSKQFDQDQTEMELLEDSEVILGKTDQPDCLDQGHPQTIEVNQTDADTYNNLGGVLVGQGKLEEAVQVYHQALEINPNDADAHYNLGRALFW